MKILILGGGYMGSMVAKDLVEHGFDITVADIKKLSIRGAKTIQADLTNGKIELIGNYDLVVSAVPSWLGYGAVQAAVVAGKDCVDLSYTNENILKLDSHAKANKCTVIPDCGIAPGISNLIAGRALYIGHNDIKIYVGGIAKDKNAPMGYAVSWSIKDLCDEFVRPARILCDGKMKTVEAMSGVEKINFGELGDLDAFYTDGLRTLLYYRKEEMTKRKINLTEKTMRWAGYMDETTKLVKNGEFVKFVENNCVGLQDMLVMRCVADECVEFVVEGNDKMSAMAMTTAKSCSVFTQLLAEGAVERCGVVPPEVIAEDDLAYKFVLDRMSEHGVEFDVKYPFMEEKIWH